jgi:hypothetical protein
MKTYIEINNKILVQTEEGIISYCMGMIVDENLNIKYKLLSGTCNQITRLDESIYLKTGQAIKLEEKE